MFATIDTVKKYKVTYGGWYQRTTLHLSEIYDLFKKGQSRLNLSKDKLKEYQKLLDISEVSREAGYLEYVIAFTNTGIEIRYYEDGLYVLEMSSDEIENAGKLLEDYFNNCLNPAIDYIFSLGAPTPKVLANIKARHPLVASISVKDPEKFKLDSDKYGEVYSQISSAHATVYKTHGHIFVVSKSDNKNVAPLVEMQIFFREFKDQLEKYLNIHRNIWEDISNIKDKEYIKASDVGKTRNELESYKKTISLISNRIDQMGSYIHTRQSIAKDLKMRKELVTLFQYKFDVLTNTHDYIKEIWEMTSNFVDSAIQVIVEVENKSTSSGINTLQKITSVGVISGILGYLALSKLPTITINGAVYFLVLIFTTWVVNLLIAKLYKRKKYHIKFTERTKNI